MAKSILQKVKDVITITDKATDICNADTVALFIQGVFNHKFRELGSRTAYENDSGKRSREIQKNGRGYSEWFNSTYRKWILRDVHSAFIRVVSDETYDVLETLGYVTTDQDKVYKNWLRLKPFSFTEKQTDTRRGAKTALPPVISFGFARQQQMHNWKSAPDWLKEKFETRKYAMFVGRFEEIKSGIEDLMDWLYNNPQDERTLKKISVPQALQHNRDWHKRLENEKKDKEKRELEERDLKEVKIIWEDLDHRLVRLVSKGTYQREGAMMHNCVASYADYTRSSIYSWRRVEGNEPLVTIEIRDKKIAQMKGPFNNAVDSELVVTICKHLHEEGIVDSPEYKVNSVRDVIGLGLRGHGWADGELAVTCEVSCMNILTVPPLAQEFDDDQAGNANIGNLQSVATLSRTLNGR